MDHIRKARIQSLLETKAMEDGVAIEGAVKVKRTINRWNFGPYYRFIYYLNGNRCRRNDALQFLVDGEG